MSRAKAPILAFLLFLAVAVPAIAEEWCFVLQSSGCTYCASNFRGVAHASEAACGGLVPAMHDLVEEIESAFRGASPSTLNLASGAQAIHIDGSGFGAGIWVTVVKEGDTAKALFGQLTAFDEETGDGTLNASEVAGSGSGLAGWRVYAQRTVATVVTPPVGLGVGGTGGTTAATARANLDVLKSRRVLHRLATPDFFTFVVGAWYLVASSAAGDFSGHENDYVKSTGGAYVFEDAAAGDVIVLEDLVEDPRLLYWTGSEWVEVTQLQPWIESPGNGAAITLVDYGPATGSGLGLGQTLTTVGADYSQVGVTTGGTVWLPATPAGPRIVAFANAAASSAKTLTIRVTGGGTISGAATVVLTGGQSRLVFFVNFPFGGKWFVTP